MTRIKWNGSTKFATKSADKGWELASGESAVYFGRAGTGDKRTAKGRRFYREPIRVTGMVDPSHLCRMVELVWLAVNIEDFI